MDDKLFNEEHEVKSNWVKFGKIGDWIKGTLVDVREMKSTLPGAEGKLVKVYEFIAQDGQFHDIDENKKPVLPPIKINQGDYWTVGGKPIIDNQMRNIKLGQIVGMRFAEERPPKKKGFSPLKIIKIYAGGMDPSYQGQTSLDEIVK